jgi:hypothetical protein
VKAVRVSLAQGADQSVDPRVAPNGTLASVQNLRIDKQGRGVLRNGYQSLGVTVHDGGTQLVPFDLHEHNGSLICLGNNSPTNQTGIRAAYEFEPVTQEGSWKTSNLQSIADNAARFVGITPADSPRILFSHDHSNVQENVAIHDIAAIGSLLCVVSGQETGGVISTHIEIVNSVTRNVIHEETRTGVNPRVIAVGNLFLVFFVNPSTAVVSVTQYDVTSSTSFGTTFSGFATLGSVTSNYDVAPVELGTTEYLIAFATGTGYTWQRNNAATNANLATRSEVALANGAISICGAVGETVNVLYQRAVNGFDLRTYALAGGAPTLGPTNIDATGSLVFGWVGITRFSSTQVYCIGQQTTVSSDVAPYIVTTTGAHTSTQQQILQQCRTYTRAVLVDGQPFIWAALGGETRRSYGLMRLSTNGSSSTEIELAAVCLQGQAKTDYTAPALAAVQHMAVIGRKLYAALIGRDSRDGSFRMQVVETPIWSGERRQGAPLGNLLYLAGGCLTQYDGRTPVETGWDTAPTIPLGLSQTTGGSLTLLGAYQYFLVYRAVSRDGEVTQSAPGGPFTITLTGANNRVEFLPTSPYSRRFSRIARGMNVTTYLDVYRTEAGGSIPRLVQTLVMRPSSITLGGGLTVQDNASDVTQQAGAKLYTQGADGAVSGRLPLAIAGGCRNVVVSEGKLWLAGIERRTQYRLSVESRPGESSGFVNDDLFFGTNSEDVTALAVGTDGRRLLFSATNVREVRGEGPNAAGIGDLSEPIEVDGQVGCPDWRSVCKCELGVLFRASDTRIYLLPVGGGAAISAAESIQDVLRQFPVTTGAVRHEADELVTFTVTNAAGTDGRLLHLDLSSSGMTRNGWVSRWIVDRLQQLEDVAEIQVVSESVQSFEGLPTSLSVAVPSVANVGDRVLLLVSASGTAGGQSILSVTGGGWSFTSFASATGMIGVAQRISTGTDSQPVVNLAQASAAIVRVLHLRGAHATQPFELVQAIAGPASSVNVGALTPSWGSAKNMWIAACSSSAVFGSAPPMLPQPVFVSYPSGFDYQRQENQFGAGLLGCALATCRTVQAAASLDPSAFTTAGAVDLAAVIIAIRPAGVAGTPVRAPVQFGGRLVVCNSSDVLRSTAGSFADQGGVFIVPELMTADMYPMGPGGRGKHLSVVFVGEYRQPCLLWLELSYDSGITWTATTPFRLDASQYTAGQTLRLQWVPRRRKIEGVRGRFTVTDSGFGPSEGVVFQEAFFYFENLIGAPKLPASQRK